MEQIWIVLPTYNEAENIRTIVADVRRHLASARLLIVDDNSPDGTGLIAQELAATDDHVRVLHRDEKQGLGKAYVAGFKHVLAEGADAVIQMDGDGSHDPKRLPYLIEALENADLVIGSRYVRGGAVRNWGLTRKVISRGGSLFARVVLGLHVHDLTGGFKAWRADTLRRLALDKLRSGGYVFQIEATYRAARQGARIVEVPITFVDRVAGTSKMSRRIVAEALVVVVSLRWNELQGQLRRR